MVSTISQQMLIESSLRELTNNNNDKKQEKLNLQWPKIQQGFKAVE